jgi:antitoxin PrlF
MATQLTRIQDKGQVTIPRNIRKRLKLKKGDLVTFVETEQGVVLLPAEAVVTSAFSEIGRLLKGKGVTLGELLESGEKVRSQIAKEKYGLGKSPSKSKA